MADDIYRQVHRAFRPVPLAQDDLDALYVDLDDVRGQLRPVRVLAARIRQAEPGESTCQLLAGHRGSGKSTELAKLCQDLEANGDYLVVTFTAEEELDLNDVDAPDLLFAIARVLCLQAKARLGQDLTSSTFSTLWDRFCEALNTDIVMESAKFKPGPLEVSAAIKNSPDYRRKVRHQVEPESAALVAAVNDLISDFKSKLTRAGQELVLIVDDLDKLVSRPLESIGCAHDEHLFINREPQLTALRCHVVYTLPLELAYSHHEQVLEDRYGGPLPVIPMVRVSDRPDRPAVGSGGQSGREALRKVVERRLASEDLTEKDIFAPDILDRLIAFSGGQPSALLTSIQDAALLSLPIDGDGFHRVQINRRRSYARILRVEWTPLLEEARDTGKVTRSEDTDRYRRELLSSRTLLLYLNGDEWYGLNPALAGVPLPQPRAET